MQKANLSNSAKKFSYKPQSVQVAKLKLHPFFQMLGCALTDKYVLNNIKHFNYFERPVITEDGYVISHPTDFLAAKKLLVKTIEVVLIKGINANDIVRFISFRNIYKHGENREALTKVVAYLTEFLKTTEEGKQWAKEIPAPKTRGKVAKILGISDGTIQNIQTLGKSGNDVARSVDNKKIPQSRVVKKEGSTNANNNNNATHKRLELSNVQGVSNVPVEGTYPVEGLQFSIRDLGTFRFEFIDGLTKLFHNSKEVSGFCRAEEFNSDDKIVDFQHLAILPGHGQYAVHFSLRNIENFVDQFKNAA